MPNWCFNNLVLYSNNKDTLESIRKVFCEDKLLDYLVPMPEGLKTKKLIHCQQKNEKHCNKRILKNTEAVIGITGQMRIGAPNGMLVLTTHMLMKTTIIV